MLYGCRKMQLKELQYVQNTAARIVLPPTRKFEHITPALFDLHWLPVSYRIIVFKLLLLVFKSLNNLSPSYLAEDLRAWFTRRVIVEFNSGEFNSRSHEQLNSTIARRKLNSS